ncbi:hypothetical protein BD309DRAFT_964029 [Dichomitus squalens]|nr:hypothetical protein BD309DRAFT_964029 [Dichomitus squalens]
MVFTLLVSIAVSYAICRAMATPTVDLTPSSAPCLFPPEIDWLILDQLQDDKVTLFSCTFVCSPWRLYSQTILFRSLRICCPTGASFHQIVTFLEEDHVPQSHIANSIWHLRLNGERDKATYQEFPPSPEAVITIYALRRILNFLPRLQSLSSKLLLLSSEIPSLSPPLESTPAPNPPRKEPLEFALLWCSSATGDLRDLFKVLSLFSELHRLKIDSGKWSKATIPPPGQDNEFLHGFPTVECAELEGLGPRCIGLLFNQLRQSGRPGGRLTSLHFKPALRLDFEALNP